MPTEGQVEDVSAPTTVIGTGSPAGCTGDAFVSAVAKGGIVTFDCGPAPATIVLTQTAKVFNDKGTKLIIDGHNKVTLSGGGKVRILYMATCDKAQVYPPGPGDCNTNPGVQLVVQNITFVDGNAKGIPEGTNNGAGGGAIRTQGGSLKVVNARFFNNVCDDLGSDLGGGAIRKTDYLVASGALKEIGLPQSHLPLALLCFNAGVEIGQLLMVLVVFVVVRLPVPQRWLGAARRPTLYGIGTLAAYWSWLRIAAIAF